MITWLSHAGFKIECTEPSTNEKRIIYIDPWFGSPLCPEPEKNPDKADLILITHGHFDHASDAPELAKRTNAPVVGCFELCNGMTTQGVPHTNGMNKGGTVEYDFCWVTMVPADHSSCGPPPEMQYAGAPAGYVVKFKDGSPTIYHAGDTNVFTDMKIVSDLYTPQIALLPIGGHFTMGPREAAYALNKFLDSVTTVVPMHYGTFPLLKGTPAELETELTSCFPREQKAQVRNLEIGETVSLIYLL